MITTSTANRYFGKIDFSCTDLSFITEARKALSAIEPKELLKAKTFHFQLSTLGSNYREPISVKTTIDDGEVFMDLYRKEHPFAIKIPLIPLHALPGSNYRDDMNFVYARSLTNSLDLSVIDATDHIAVTENFHSLLDSDASSQDSTYLLNPASGEYFQCRRSDICFRQPVSHIPTRTLMDSIRKMLKTNIRDLSHEDNCGAAECIYIIDKTLESGHIDTSPINPIAILESSIAFLEQEKGIYANQAASLVTIIKKYTKEMESLATKYSLVWPSVDDVKSVKNTLACD